MGSAFLRNPMIRFWVALEQRTSYASDPLKRIYPPAIGRGSAAPLVAPLYEDDLTHGKGRMARPAS
jgi:hypothetical protein